jgi:CheY-like chemotaxis protein
MHSAQSQARPHILVVEDDPLVSAMIRDALDYAGFEATCVIAGEDALSLAMMEVPIDLVLTDIELAGPMDGWELAEAMREMRGNVPIIYASAHANGTRMRVGNSLFVSKPYSPLALCNMIRELVGTPAAHKPDIAPASPRVIQLEERRALRRA